MKTLYFASENRGKTQEVQSLFKGFALVRDLKDVGIPVTWEETGLTFLENAQIKARAVSERIEGDVFADDSGLCVQALNGAPGVYSARWAGLGCDDKANNEKLLRELSKIPNASRQAKFVCSIVYINHKKEEFFFEAQMSGRILKDMRGTQGFGYDPLFVPDAFDKSLAEMSLEEKNKISHRFKALSEFRNFLERTA